MSDGPYERKTMSDRPMSDCPYTVLMSFYLCNHVNVYCICNYAYMMQEHAGSLMDDMVSA